VGWGADDDEPFDARAAREADNGVRQALQVASLVRHGVADPSAFRLTLRSICELNRLAVEGVVPTAGRPRQRSDIEISGSSLLLPKHEDVPALLDDLCATVEQRWHEDALFLSAYVLWRLCWIHPFDDGNGRTARAASYVVLSVRLGLELPGARPIPARIKYAPLAYVRALEAADAKWAAGELDVSQMEKLLAFYLQAQLNDDPPSLPP